MKARPDGGTLVLCFMIRVLPQKYNLIHQQRSSAGTHQLVRYLRRSFHDKNDTKATFHSNKTFALRPPLSPTFCPSTIAQDQKAPSGLLVQFPILYNVITVVEGRSVGPLLFLPELLQSHLFCSFNINFQRSYFLLTFQIWC